MIYSVIETAKENGLNPYNYLLHLFEQLQQLPDPLDPPRLNRSCLGRLNCRLTAGRTRSNHSVVEVRSHRLVRAVDANLYHQLNYFKTGITCKPFSSVRLPNVQLIN
jgi:hypothetical protein